MSEESRTGNRLLDELLPHEFERIAPALDEEPVDSGQIINRVGEHLGAAYFPSTCVLSSITTMRDGTSVEIGTIGREGVLGSHLVLGDSPMLNQTICQIRGRSFVMPIATFESEIARGGTLRSLVQRYAQGTYLFMSQSIACNRLHTLIERCARWLLLTHDRTEGDELPLTQEFLSIMLGVHRPGVSVAAATLQKAGFINYRRGHVTIVDREGLESAACECYRVIADEFDRLLTKPDGVSAGRTG